MRQLIFAFVLALVALTFVPAAGAVEVDVSLRGSPNSMLRQNDIARDLGLHFVREPDDVKALVERGELVRLNGNAFYHVNRSVSYPYGRPEVRLFIERLARQYYEGTGERLVVTSLTRPSSEQPRNSHDLSVHPTGIAIDLRVSSMRQSRAWLESVLLKLEGNGLLDVTRERWPPHYHVALFPDAYRAYLEEMVGTEKVAEALRFEERLPAKPATVTSLPPAQVIAAAAPPDDSAWKLLFIGAPLLLLALSVVTFLRKSFELRR